MSNAHAELTQLVMLLCRQHYGKSIMFSGCVSVRPSVSPLTSISHDNDGCEEISVWDLAQIFNMWVSTAEKVFKVRGQRSRSYV